MTTGNGPLASLTHAQLVGVTDEFLDQVLERLNRADTPLWEHQAHMGRTVITLAGGGIIASVSVVQFLADKIASPAWSWLLPSSWIAWTACILAALSRELWIGQARSLAAILERSRGALRLKIQQLEADSTVDDLERLMVDAFNEADREPAEARRVLASLNQLVFWTFAGGIVGLVIFAIKNLPF